MCTHNNNRFDSADALELLVEWLLRAERQQQQQDKDRGTSAAFPALSILSALTVLARPPPSPASCAGAAASYNGPHPQRPPTMGRLATALLARAKQQGDKKTTPDVVLRAAYRTKQVWKLKIPSFVLLFQKRDLLA